MRLLAAVGLWLGVTTALYDVTAIDVFNRDLVNNHRAWMMLNQDCGESYVDRIVGGVEATLGQFPWIARLGYTDGPSTQIEFKCGGALINPWYVLTAAHCVTKLDPSLRVVSVRMGEHDASTFIDCRAGVCAPPPQDREIARSIHHPRFNNPPFANDIALLEVVRPFEITGYVSTACLPRGPHLRDVQDGEIVTAAGWGIMNMTTMDVAIVLQTIQLPILNRSKCKNLGRNHIPIAESQICAGAEMNKDACSGDSGGPLMKVESTEEGPRTFVVGVVSFGPDLCGFGLPGVYTSVSRYMLWILGQLVFH